MTFREVPELFSSSFTGHLFTEYPPVPGTVLEARHTAVNVTDKSHCPHRTYIQWKERDKVC